MTKTMSKAKDMFEHGMNYQNIAEQLESENTELRKLFEDFWEWTDPPFGMKSGSFSELLQIMERMQKLGFYDE